VKSEGQLREIDFPGMLVELWRERFTGAVRLENDSIIKIIYFKEGDLLSASTNDRGDSIGEILLRHEKVSREHLKQALAKRKDAESLGDSLLGLGFITRKELTWARRAQLVGAMRSIFEWDDAEFSVIRDYVPKREEGTSFEFPQVFLEVLLTSTNREAVDAALQQGELVLAPTADFAGLYPALNLNEEADEVAELVDGSRTAADIASQARADRFNVYKLLVALRHLGLVTPLSPPEIPVVVGEEHHMEEAPVVPSFDEAPLVPEPTAVNEYESVEEAIVDEPVKKSGRGVMLVLALAVVLLLVAAYILGAGKLLKKTPASEPAPAASPSPTAQEPTPLPIIEAPVQEGSPIPTLTAAEPAASPSVEVAEPSPAPAAGTDPVRSRYDQMALEYARSIAPGTYTVQFGIFCRTDSITRALRDHAQSVWFVPVDFRGESCFRAYWGRYRSREEAAAAMDTLPGALREGATPAVVMPSRAN
jgi:hypothetical protein